MFEGLESGPGSLVKYNPLSNISSAEVWNFLRVMVRPLRLCVHPRVAARTWRMHCDQACLAVALHMIWV